MTEYIQHFWNRFRVLLAVRRTMPARDRHNGGKTTPPPVPPEKRTLYRTTVLQYA